MAAQVTNYQCPSCTGPLHFSSKTNRLECDYCGSSYEVSEIDEKFNAKIDEAKNESDKKQKDNQEKWDVIGLRSYTCSSCGAEIICDETTVATSCPYCANPTVIPGQFKDGHMQDLVSPFSVDKKDAIEALKNHYNKKRLLPSVFSKENHIEEVKGIYVPFWLYDGDADVQMSFVATRSSVTRTAKKEIITTSHYKINRAGTVPFEKVPVDASKKMDNDLMDSIEPFDYSKLVEFTPSYLPGYFAESYDENQEDCKPRVNLRIENSACSEISKTVVGYETVTATSKNVKINYKNIKYAFLPVWLLTTKWKDQVFMFSMNGQTGNLVGNLPVDWGKFWKYFFGIFAGVGVAATAIMYFIMKVM